MLRFCSKNHFDYIPASITFGTKKIKYKSSVFLSLLDKQESDLNNLRLHARSGGVMFFSMHSTLLAQYTCWFNPFSFIYIYTHNVYPWSVLYVYHIVVSHIHYINQPITITSTSRLFRLVIFIRTIVMRANARRLNEMSDGRRGILLSDYGYFYVYIVCKYLFKYHPTKTIGQRLRPGGW